MRPAPRVVITGAGVVTALGRGWQANASGFRAGQSGFRPITLFAVDRQRVKIAAEVDLPAHLPPTRLHPRTEKRLDRAARILLWAAHEAWQQSGWEPGEELPLVLGTTSAGMPLGQDFYRQAISHPGNRRRQPRRIVHYQAQQHGIDVANAFGFSGPLTIIANACASGGNAIGQAWSLIRRGQYERVFTGGFDGLCHLVFSGFDALQAMSPRPCRPFDAHRDGLSLGEGAAMFTLETLEYARQRGAIILGELVGYGAATDLHHLTQPQPEGDAALAAMTEACHSAGLTPDQIQYVNAHGTGTPLNDSAEAAALSRWAGAHVSQLAVSSTKASVGHLLGGAGAVETVVCLMALRGQWLPPSTTTETVDPVCAFHLVRQPEDARLAYALTNSFGFGGSNASLILRRWTE